MLSRTAFDHLREMKFMPDSTWPDSLVGRLQGGVVLKAVGHPLYGVVLMGHYMGPRTLVEFEERISLDASREQVAQAIVRIIGQIGDSDPEWRAKYMEQ